MNISKINYDPRVRKIRKDIVTRLGSECPQCKTEDVVCIGQLDEEVTLKCSRCNYIWEIEFLQE